METYSIESKKISWHLNLWLISLCCEAPYYFLMAFLVALFEVPASEIIFFLLLLPLFIGLTSLGFRFVTLHVAGSWILKRILMARGAGPILFALADFILAHLWLAAWALVHPDWIVMTLFRYEDSDQFVLTRIWYIAIPPIALGSLTFRWIYGKYFENKNIHARKSTKRLLEESI